MEIVSLAFIVGTIAIIVMVLNMFLPDGSQALQKKFISMGNMKGKKLAEIVAVAGPFKIRQTLKDGTAYTWGKAKYAICLAFDVNGICTRVLSEVVK